MKTPRFKNAAELTKEQALELCDNCQLPTTKTDVLINRQNGHPLGIGMVYRENRKYYLINNVSF